ncbi:MAG TPA: hypothetical protein VN132_06765 [Bdellovibrio sp.]|nr:hypothetical protein [Bdellovibrio sp.]
MTKSLLLTLVMQSQIFAQQRSVDEICKTTTCRSPHEIQIPLDDAHYKVFNIPKSPFVDDGVVNVANEEVVHVKVNQKDGKVISLEYSSVPADIEISFNVKRAVPASSTTMVIKSNLDKPFIYSILVNAPKSDWRFFATSSCPVKAKMSTYENWPHPISQVVLRNFRFVNTGTSECKKY